MLYIWSERYYAGRGGNKELRENLEINQRDNNCIRLIKDLENLAHSKKNLI